MRRVVRVVIFLILVGCNSALAATAAWQPLVHLPLVVDVAGPRAVGALVATAGGRLDLVKAGRTSPFAPGYSTNPGTEPYIATAGAGCFHRDDVYALDLRKPFGIVRIGADGHPARFAELPAVDTLSGITFDTTGAFAHRLLVTAALKAKTVVAAVDCSGKVTVITRNAPAVEGGIAVAPASFGAFARDLIAPDERSGNIVAIRPDGSASVVVRSGLPTGQDIGVESAGFVPKGFSGAAYLADRSSPGSPTRGNDTILTLSVHALRKAGVRDGDLLVATEAVGRTIAVRCAATCTAIKVAEASAAAHPEGHILFAADMPKPGNGAVRWIALPLLAAALLLLTARARRARSP